MRFKCLQQPLSKSHWTPCDSMKFNQAKQSTLSFSPFPQFYSFTPPVKRCLHMVCVSSLSCIHCYQILSEHYVLVQSLACACLYVSLISSKGVLFNLPGIQGWTLCLKILPWFDQNQFLIFWWSLSALSYLSIWLLYV